MIDQRGHVLIKAVGDLAHKYNMIPPIVLRHIGAFQPRSAAWVIKHDCTCRGACELNAFKTAVLWATGKLSGKLFLCRRQNMHHIPLGLHKVRRSEEHTSESSHVASSYGA